jgi:tetratricopeptide (TPR) repeat protein
MMAATAGKEKKIYLKSESVKLGAGSTAKPVIIENYYQGTETDGGKVELRLLDIQDQPFGQPILVTPDELKEYVYCEDYFEKKKDHKTLRADKHVQLGDTHLEKREFHSAEFEYNQAISLNEDHLRANIGKGKALYARGDKEEARKIFSKVSQIKALFEKENKHIFNEFGIELRKKAMFDEAVSSYLKAISIDSKDEVLYYNLGRAYYEMKNGEEAVRSLKTALSLKSDFPEAREFLSKIEVSIARAG